MPPNKSNVSFNRLLMWALLSVGLLTFLATVIFSFISFLKIAERSANNQLEAIAKITASSIGNDVALGNNEDAKDKLGALIVTPRITHAHIYAVDNDNNFTFYTSYNQLGQATIGSQIDNLERVYNLREIDDIFEFAVPIDYLGRKVGVLYIRASSSNTDTLIRETALQFIFILFCVGLACYLIAIKLQSLITTPLEKLSELLYKVARNRNYDERAKDFTISEVVMVSDAVNFMLSRVQDIILKQQEAEEQHKTLNASLEQIVGQRTIALKEANQELIKTLEKLHQFQRQIVENEKMASLGDMVAGVAHEVNTPIGLGVTASTMMLDRLSVIQQQFESKTLRASTMARFIEEGQENLNIIYRNLNRAAELISSFKQVAVDQKSEIDRIVNMHQLIKEIVLSLRPRLKKTKHTVNIDCAESLNVETKAGPINQIFINLIINSIIHGFNENDEGKINIAIEEENNNLLRIIYKDNGKGIPKEMKTRIYDPFVTTKRGQGGSGLGMHLVYNLVTQALNGTISLISEEGKGVEFMIVFPIKKPKNAYIDK